MYQSRIIINIIINKIIYKHNFLVDVAWNMILDPVHIILQLHTLHTS